MSPFDLKDIAIVATPVLTLILGVGIGIIGYFLKTIHKDFRESLRETNEKTARVERDLLDFKATLPTRYVLKDDYVRTISSFEYKLDEMFKRIDGFMGGHDGSKS